MSDNNTSTPAAPNGKGNGQRKRALTVLTVAVVVVLGAYGI